MLTCCALRLLLPHGTGFIVKAWHPVVNINRAAALQDEVAALLRHKLCGQITDSSRGACNQRLFSFHLVH